MDSPLPGANASLPVALADAEACTPAVRKARREPSPAREGDCTRGTRSFVDVMECLM
ncbi:MAG: hypothetical protein ACJ8AT_22275 [Hyalangium sp.]|uniref:hypothetical protein n=1 Tax=Hyalangium sp. TaxID=2028555 RepID=UPI00389A9DAE